jgi:hypothetical protein
LHTSPDPQLVPSARLVNVVVLVPGWQLAQPPPAVAPDAYTVPPMTH